MAILVLAYIVMAYIVMANLVLATGRVWRGVLAELIPRHVQKYSYGPYSCDLYSYGQCNDGSSLIPFFACAVVRHERW